MRPFVLIFVLLFSSSAAGQQLKEITNSIGMKLKLIHAGSFTMGSPIGEVGRKDRQTQQTSHEVTISNSYYLGVFEVTQGEYEKVIGNNPSGFKRAMNPVDTSSWDDAASFCKRLSELPEERVAGREYRLPTEAEWEYACRAGSTTSYSFGDTAESLWEFAWFFENSEFKSHPVGEKKANRWGLHDMHGNVSEWCQDWFSDSSSGSATDPKGPSGGSHRVIRGGSWFLAAGFCRSSFRELNDPKQPSSLLGFRVAMTPPVKQPKAASIK